MECFECGKQISNGSNLANNGEHVCDKCLKEYYFYCKTCEEYCHESAFDYHAEGRCYI